MSHGPASEGAATEPNLTPLLDVVMQLLMFFMMCVNFTQEQANQDIVLPSAEAARPIDPSESDVLYVNMKPYRSEEWASKPAKLLEQIQRDFRNEGDTMVLTIGKDPMRPIDARVWLIQFFKDRQNEERLKDRSNPDPKVKTVIILRASEDLNCDQVYQMMDIAKVAGFKELRLRAKIQQNPQSGGGGH